MFLQREKRFIKIKNIRLCLNDVTLYSTSPFEDELVINVELIKNKNLNFKYDNEEEYKRDLLILDNYFLKENKNNEFNKNYMYEKPLMEGEIYC